MIEIDFKKGDGLIPVIIQDASTHEVLMLGYMNQEAWEETLRTKKACFLVEVPEETLDQRRNLRSFSGDQRDVSRL